MRTHERAEAKDGAVGAADGVRTHGEETAAGRAGPDRTAPAPAGTDTVELHDGTRWRLVCAYADLPPGRGVAALLDGEQIALFRDRAGALWAVGNRDPFSGAYVLARGLLGSRGTAPTLASPMYHHVFDLRDGRCLDEDTAPDGTPAVLRVWPVRSRPRPEDADGPDDADAPKDADGPEDADDLEDADQPEVAA
ncbi:nitrite reductase (NAD(P)H) small subunit [Streptomyces sp. NPDC003077]|uniref:nitrite reductase (NAD(P)H) small subunit n=1 Tax=Streptomyces sp. NPDC003077 TaxID=3154443 RepID=UPI0033ADC139